MRGYLEVRANLPAKVTRPEQLSLSARILMDRMSRHEVSKRIKHVPAQLISKKVNGNEFMGSWPAIWLLGYQPPTWPACGELDMVEVVNGRPSVVFNQSDYYFV